MIDRFGRTINYLRLSVTEKCQLHCDYCRSSEECPNSKELTAEEILQLSRVCVNLGLDKIRLTGGEPLMRRDIIEIAESIGRLENLRELTMTTNGQKLSQCAKELYRAGIHRINISLDSLNADRYRSMTGGDINKVFSAIEEAKRAGMNPIKINAVLLRGINDGEVKDFLHFSREYGVIVRFIELMPLGRLSDKPEMRITMKEILKENPELMPGKETGEPAREFYFSGSTKAGIIAPMSEPFCDSCNRIRILSDGTLKPCLGCGDEISLSEFIGGDERILSEKIEKAVFNKPMGYTMRDCEKPLRDMSRIGG